MLYRGFASQAELDRAYDVEQSVPDFPRYAEWFTGESDAARRELTSRLDVRFGPTLDETLDIFPAKSPGAPIFVFIHGGYWRILSSKEFSFVARALVGLGVAVVVTNYSLCPKVTIDEILRQSRAALYWVYRNADGFGGDPQRIYIGGHSAGAQQVAMVLATDWEREYGAPANLVKGACAISGLYDLSPLPHTFVQPSLLLDEAQVRRNSPLHHIPDRSPPLIVSYGEDEPPEFRRQSEEFFQAWRGKGLIAELLRQPKANHFSALAGFLDPNSPLLGAIRKQID
jgi:arylformamidase